MKHADLEQAFEAALKGHLEKASSVAEVATKLLEDIAREGALSFMKRYLGIRWCVGDPGRSIRALATWPALPKHARDFGGIVSERGRPDLTLEKLVMSPQWKGLFTEEELAVARARQPRRENRKIERKSQELLESLEDEWPETGGDSESEEWARKTRNAVRQLARSKQKFQRSKTSALKELNPPAIEEWLDACWTEELLEQIPQMVKRTMLLDDLLIPENCSVPPEVDVYVREAVRCYIFGLWQSSVAMARATLELALQDVLKSNDQLAALIQRAANLSRLDRKHEEKARRVKTVANGVLHFHPTTDKQALDVVRDARAVLIHLYTKAPS
jgi:hypothetical protein